MLQLAEVESVVSGGGVCGVEAEVGGFSHGWGASLQPCSSPTSNLTVLQKQVITGRKVARCCQCCSCTKPRWSHRHHAAAPAPPPLLRWVQQQQQQGGEEGGSSDGVLLCFHQRLLGWDGPAGESRSPKSSLSLLTAAGFAHGNKRDRTIFRSRFSLSTGAG